MLNPPINWWINIVLRRLRYCTTSPLQMALQLTNSSKCFEGEQRFYTHYSYTVNCNMNISVYLPPKATKEKQKCPVLYFLNGLTATHENFVQKSGVQRFASKYGICIVSPDTSPRDVDVPKHEILGPGAGFYINAIQKPWSKHYQMFSYVTEELVQLVNNNFPVIKDKQSISGFSMGGYGALMSYLRYPGFYTSVSAFAPVCNPMKGGIPLIALTGYMGKNEEVWKDWDPSVIAEKYSGKPIEIFIDYGTHDEYNEGKHLRPESLIQSTENNDCVKIIYKEREGYNHSHYFVSTFIHEHMEYHAKFLNS